MSFLRGVLARLGLASLSPSTDSGVADLDPTQPDLPQGFGYKTNWFAIRTTDGAAVAETMALADLRPANWAAGLKHAYQASTDPKTKSAVFISPAIDGWTFVIGGGLPYPVDHDPNGGQAEIGARFRAAFQRLASRFDDVQFFGSHRVVDFCAWARARDGVVIRAFSWSGSDGECMANEGAQTPEERALGLLDLGLRGPEAARDYMFEREEAAWADAEAEGGGAPDGAARATPSEEDVTNLAGAWSLDPIELGEMKVAPGLGWLAYLTE